jgi:ceramide glucosyltransferase
MALFSPLFSPVWFLTVFVAFTCAVQLISIFIMVFRTQVSAPSHSPLDLLGVSIIRPVCGLENNLEETLESTFLLDYPLYEIIFCVASQRDPAIVLVKSAMLRHPTIAASLLIGDDQFSVNPKLNNMKKGWDAARYDWVVMADSNVLLPHNYLQCILSRWTPTTGLVSSPAIGTRPVGIWAEIECAFLNTYQARWQLVADQIGLGFAQGKNLCWKRQFLENAGGIRAMAAEIAEDVASTKIVRNAGLNVRLTLNPFPQPLGYRSKAEVWNRQVRWARLRRVGLKAYFIPELLSGGLFPLVAASLIVYLGGYSPSYVFVLFLAWYGAEAMLAKLAGWPINLRAIFAIVLRDLLLPVIWFSAWGNGTFVWHGNVMSTRKNIRSTFSADA